MVPRYKDRQHAGEKLAEALADWSGADDVIVLGLPRGGIPVASAVVDRLRAPLDVLVVRKLGVPGHEELAMGAVASGGIVVRNHDVIDEADIDEATFELMLRAESAEAARRDVAFRGDRPPPDLAGRNVVLVDDGLATGASMKAALAAVRSVHPNSVVVAVPVGQFETCEELERLADIVLCMHRPSDLGSVGNWYDDFEPTSDEEVHQLLADHWSVRPAVT